MYPVSPIQFQRLMPMAMMYHGWSMGLMSLPLLAWLIPNWRQLNLAIAGALLLTVPSYFLMPESLYWLSNNALDEVGF